MTDWKTMEERPTGVFDVLARHYDASLNRFLIQRITNCIEQDFQILWAAPFVGVIGTINLHDQGYRVVRWRPAPGPEDLPDDLKEILQGPEDHPTAS